MISVEIKFKASAFKTILVLAVKFKFDPSLPALIYRSPVSQVNEMLLFAKLAIPNAIDCPEAVAAIRFPRTLKFPCIVVPLAGFALSTEMKLLPVASLPILNI